MKRTTLLAGAILASMSFSAAAIDAGTSYFGAGYNRWDVSVDTPFGSGSAEPGGLEGRFGYFFSDSFAVETRFGFGLSDDQGVEITRNIGVYLKGVIDTGAFKPYGFIGYTDIEAEADGFTESDNDMSFGVGAMMGSGSTMFNLEWSRMYSDDGGGVSLDIDTLQLGVVTTF